MEKRILSCKSDRISKLPVEVKDIILTFLPLREAVRTSILSTKWRHVWTNLSKLVFDNTVSKSQDNEPLTRYKLISTINQILLLRDGPIHKFSLSHSVIQSCPDIDNITIFLSKNCVREFSLEILKGEKHKLHSSFFFWRELTHLNLCDCVFTPPPAFKGFPKLVSVKFVNVDFSTDMFGNFVSSCPQLESMTLINPPKFKCLPISAPNLKFLEFHGNCESLCFGDAPVLQVVSFITEEMRISKEGEKCRFVEFFRCLPALKKLATSYSLLQHLAAGVAPMKLPSSIGLQILELSSISFVALDELSSIYDDPADATLAQVVDFLKAQVWTADITLDELVEVHLTCVSGKEPELEFIKLLLAKSRTLKTMLIKPKKKDDFSKLELLTKLTRYHRASPMAEIIYE